MINKNLFADNAPHYWNVGLPVIPLRTWDSVSKGAGKAPILSEWQTYGEAMPSVAVRELWMQSYPDCNIGLPFGPASGLCAIDIDTEDQSLIDAILDALPASPWVRVGRKGMGLIYRWNSQRNFKLRDSENRSIVEFLGKGNQMVLPPSIHPDTGRPYEANVPLWEVMDKIQTMPLMVEQLLREALGDRGISVAASTRSKALDVVPEGERDIQMVRQAGYLARVVQGIDKRAKYSLAEAIEHMHTWVVEYTSKAAGDDMDPAKGVAKLLEFLLKDVEAGMTLPNGWDNGLTEAMEKDPVVQALREKNHSQRWTFSKARAWFDKELGGDGGEVSDDHILTALNELVDQVAADDNFTDIEFSTLVNYIMSRVGKSVGLSKPDVKKMFKDAKKLASGNDAEADHDAIARRVIDDFNRFGELRHAQGKFWQWNGSCFECLDDDVITTHIGESIKGNGLSRRVNDYLALTKLIGKLVKGPLVDEMEIGINFANGFLDTAGELQAHNPKYGKTFTLPFNYVPERAGEAHKWFEYLERSWGDDPDYAEKVAALQEAFAATLFGVAPQYQRAILLYGKAGTGKSQALEVLRALMPPGAIASVGPGKWGERFALSSLVGKTLNVCGELPENSLISGDKFKEVVEGAVQNTEFKSKDAFEFKPVAAHWFASNHLPRSRDYTEGFTRRWLILEFNRKVPLEERIPDFHLQLVAEEREAITAWAVQGLDRLRRQREYTQPSSHLARIGQITRMNNSVMAWLQSNEKVRPDPDFNHTADAGEAFNHYVFYMKEVARSYSVRFEQFVQMMDDLGHRRNEYRDALGVQKLKLHGLHIKSLEESVRDRVK